MLQRSAPLERSAPFEPKITHTCARVLRVVCSGRYILPYAFKTRTYVRACVTMFLCVPVYNILLVFFSTFCVVLREGFVVAVVRINFLYAEAQHGDIGRRLLRPALFFSTLYVVLYYYIFFSHFVGKLGKQRRF